jgi:NAD+ synthase
MSVTNLQVNWGLLANEITHFIRKVVDEADAEGVVVGLSGGIDSSLVAKLCVSALGQDRVLGAILPVDFTPPEDVRDAKDLAGLLGIRAQLVSIQQGVDSFVKMLGLSETNPQAKIPLANIRSRLRMVTLYYLANMHNYLVAGTGDRSEDLIGYFTKYGDGGVDFLPISHLYKTQVRELAKYLGIPSKIASKPSSPQLYAGHKATDEIPIDYDKLDLIQIMLFDKKLSADDVAERTGASVEVVKDVVNRHRISAHKRCYPKMVRDW